MKFAGPSMGAALGSGILSGAASAQELQTKEELARDTSAMATYSKLMQSGEWEPVGKEGVADGGVLRVGNVGYLKKRKGGGTDLKGLNYLSQIKRREDLTRLGRRAQDLRDSDKGSFTVYTDGRGNKKRVYEGEELPGPGWTREVGVNLVTARQSDTRLDVGLDKTYYLKELDSANKTLAGLPPDFIITKLRNDPSKKGIVKSYDEAMQKKVWAMGGLKKLGGGSVSDPTQVGGPTKGVSPGASGISKFAIEGGSPENVKILEDTYNEPEGRKFLDGLMDRIKNNNWDFISFMNRLAEKIKVERKDRPKPFEVDTRVAP
jgi:hypothetical protein